MLKICKQDKSKVMEQIKHKVLDGIKASNSNLIDDIILSMCHEGILDNLEEGFVDKRKRNSTIPFKFIMALAIASKMKVKTSLTDIPYAITDYRALAKLGFNAMNTDDTDGWFDEGTIRHLLGKYDSTELFDYYNRVVQNHIFEAMDIKTNIHILDCTKIEVNYTNNNYEDSSFGYNRLGKTMRGYKLASLRGVYNRTGLIEDVRFGTVSTHDLKLSEEMLRTTPCFHEGDIVIMDRGFISREMINHLKTVRKVDTYIPVKKNMSIYELAVSIANEIDDWKPHPTRKNQMICHVNNVGEYWHSDNKNEDVDLNSCVVWIEENQSYAVFITTDMSKSANDIILIYQTRPEIEEDFRQLKDFWKLEDFKSTKLHMISFHLVCVLFGYLFYQLYLSTDDGQKYIGKCLPVILKNYKEEFLNYLVLFSGEYFCTMSMREFLEFRDECSSEIRKFILEFFS